MFTLTCALELSCTVILPQQSMSNFVLHQSFRQCKNLNLDFAFQPHFLDCVYLSNHHSTPKIGLFIPKHSQPLDLYLCMSKFILRLSMSSVEVTEQGLFQLIHVHSSVSLSYSGIFMKLALRISLQQCHHQDCVYVQK